MIKEIKNTLLKTYWINSRINNRKKTYFNSVFIPEFLKNVNKHFIISDHYELRDAFLKSPVKGLLESIFNPNKKFFTALDLSVAINVAINGYCNENYVNNEVISDSSNYICELLKRQLYEDKIINELLKGLDKNLKDFNFQVERSKINDTLNDKISIFKTYFNRFNNDNYNTGIKVFHQAKNENWINWKEENSININHNCIEFESGFFLQGFDYQLNSGEFLRIASRVNESEYFNPKNFDWAENVIWAK